MKKLLIVAAVCTAFAGVSTAETPTAAPGFTLTVTVQGVRSDEGAIMAQLVKADRAAGKAVTIGGQNADAATGTMTLTFSGLDAGDYAVRLFHDEDGDGELKTNIVGIPKEGFGFSNGALAKFGPPKFDEMRVGVSADTATTAIMTY